MVRDGNDFYLVASSFNAVPGLPILTSRDLVNWSLVGHVLNRLEPASLFDRPQHGSGAWAPCFRKHDGTFYVYFSDPDAGMYVATAKGPLGPWSKPELVKAAKGWIDPCPFWDDDGKAYLVNAFAASRTGLKSIVAISRMSQDGKRLLDDGVLVFDGHARHPTIEGPKLYKRKGFYYVSAPAGGVPTGWQLMLRSKNIYGPYEDKVVLAQGKTAVNGPHQGALIDTPRGETWFLHYQDRGAYGRVTHLQPVKWVADWPVLGDAGEPIAGGRVSKPRWPHVPIARPPTPMLRRHHVAAQGLRRTLKPRLGLPVPAGFLRMRARRLRARGKNWLATAACCCKVPGPVHRDHEVTHRAERPSVRAGVVGHD